MPIRKQQKFNRPKKIFDKATIVEEQGLVKKYGLKNRREVWKADYAISKIREIAKKLIRAGEDEKSKFIERQKKRGFNVNSIADVLGLNKEDWLKRRLQSIIVKKSFTGNMKQARQFITHRHVAIDGKIINAPGHLTTVDEEKGVQVTLATKQKKEITDEEIELLDKMKIKPSEEVNKNE